jgi:hypothetical protein
MNHILKTVMLSGCLALCAILVGCSLSPAGEPAAQVEATSAITTARGNVCDTFCQSQGGPFFLMTFASSETACNQKGGEWFTADQGYPGPPPGCCCKCALASGNCL